jgi:predicted dehydrogenase
MNIAIIGCGNIAGVHAKVLREMGLNLALCISRDIIGAKAFAEKWQVAAYSDKVDDALEKDIDVVHVCSPPNLHYDMVKKLLEANKHVYCEKPLCLDSDQAKKLGQLAKEKAVVNAVGFNVRFHLACQKMKAFVQSDQLGKIYLVHGSYMQEFNAFPAPLDWRYNEKLAGKMRAVTEIGSHWFDLAQYITGKKITAVSANFVKTNKKRYLKDGMMTSNAQEDAKEIVVASEDAAMIQLKFADGTMGSTVLSEISQGRTNRLSLEVTGENASVWWDSENNNVLNVGKKGCGIQTEMLAFGNGFTDTFRSLFENIYGDIRKGKKCENPSYPTIEDGCQNVLLCQAAYQSAHHDSKWVQVDSI